MKRNHQISYAYRRITGREITMVIDRNKLITYWIQSSDMDYQTMIHLFEKGDYTWTLFIGHLVIEKLIKAIFAHKNAETPPYIHDWLKNANWILMKHRKTHWTL